MRTGARRYFQASVTTHKRKEPVASSAENTGKQIPVSMSAVFIYPHLFSLKFMLSVCIVHLAICEGPFKFLATRKNYEHDNQTYLKGRAFKCLEMFLLLHVFK